jgi:hypothetical protein
MCCENPGLYTSLFWTRLVPVVYAVSQMDV